MRCALSEIIIESVRGVEVTELYRLFRESSGVVTDSRQIPKGSIFFALKGDRFDGNKYALEALAKGASYAVVDSPSIEGEGVIVVDDVLATLQLLAREHRRQLPIKILAITGSNGKTTTKELITQVLSQSFRLYATRGNLNNHIGVPLTLLSFADREVGDSREMMGVVEMGASHCGEIASLCDIAEPDYGVITNIGNAHLEGFGGIEGVRRGKGELIDYLESHGGELFVADQNSEVVRLCQGRSGLRTTRYSYSLSEGVESRLEGSYNQYNIATAVAIGERFGVERGRIERAIAGYAPSNNRSQYSQSEHNSLIIDCYNANPSSMEVAIANFASHSEQPRVAILGDMYELGEWSEGEHRRILELAVNGGFERVIVVGEAFGRAAQLFEGVECFANTKELMDQLAKEPITLRLVLLKGSRSVGLERLIEYL